MKEYPIEDIREFYMPRHWLALESPDPTAPYLLTVSERLSLKNRTLEITPYRAALIRAFALGWRMRK